MITTVQPCPECYVGKCKNCTGSWDVEKDMPAACPCAIAGHTRKKS